MKFLAIYFPCWWWAGIGVASCSKGVNVESIQGQLLLELNSSIWGFLVNSVLRGFNLCRGNCFNQLIPWCARGH